MFTRCDTARSRERIQSYQCIEMPVVKSRYSRNGIHKYDGTHKKRGGV